MTKLTSELLIATREHLPRWKINRLSEEQLDTLEWARKFMNDYERKNKKESLRSVS